MSKLRITSGLLVGFGTVLGGAALLVAGCVSPRTTPDALSSAPNAASTIEVVPVSAVKWEMLNPARGDASPQAGTLWGDRGGTAPTGFLANFVDGFSSPPHIHNVTYRAVVIHGSIHNDDPCAAAMWMPVGSFWTQPRGEVHITAAKGATNMALVEIDHGPYLVMPPEEEFDSGERPINIDATNVVWVAQTAGQGSATGLAVAYLWGALQDGKPNGTFVRFPAGVKVKMHSSATTFRAVVIAGRLEYCGDRMESLEPGSYFGSKGDAVHCVSSSEGEQTLLYVRTNGPYRLQVVRM